MQMELFDKKYVHFMWDDKLLDKWCFATDCIGTLISMVNSGETIQMHKVSYSADASYPFATDTNEWRFCYYDPNYECKIAFNQGKTIQYRYDADHWVDITTSTPEWGDDVEYRIKPTDRIFSLGTNVKIPDGSIGMITGYTGYDFYEETYYVLGAWYKAKDLVLVGGIDDSKRDCHEV